LRVCGGEIYGKCMIETWGFGLGGEGLALAIDVEDIKN
jgi:hypothetical protein